MTTSTMTPPAAPAITVPKNPIKLDPSKLEGVTLLPLATIRRAANLAADANAIKVIDSVAALTTADDLASTIKALETEIETNCKDQLAPIKATLKALDASVAAVTDPLNASRVGLAERVVAAKVALGHTESTHCYASTVKELRIMEANKIPATVTIPGRNGKPDEVVALLEPNKAAIKRALDAGVHVPGVYMGEKTQIGTRGAP